MGQRPLVCVCVCVVALQGHLVVQPVGQLHLVESYSYQRQHSQPATAGHLGKRLNLNLLLNIRLRPGAETYDSPSHTLVILMLEQEINPCVVL